MFSSAKLKLTFNRIDEISSLVCSYIERRLVNGNCELNLMEMGKLYTIDVAANLFLGFDPKSLDGNFSDFHEALNSITAINFPRLLDLTGVFFMPFLHKIFKLRFLGEKYSSYIMDHMPQIFAKREQSKNYKNDFIDFLLQLKKNSNMSDSEIIAQNAVFFFAGKNF